MIDYVHLHNHSEYSLLDGMCRIKDMVAAAVECGMPALAITDHGSMFGNLPFYRACKEAGIKPILGCEVYMAPRSRFDKDEENRKADHLVLLAKNLIGYQNLIRLVTLANSEGFYYKPRIDMDLLGLNSDGLIGLSACIAGAIPRAIIADDEEKTESLLGKYRDCFSKGDFYLELQDHGIPEQALVNQVLISKSRKFDLPVIVSNDCHYMLPTDADVHDTLLCVQTHALKTAEKRLRFSSDQFYFKCQEEMVSVLPNCPRAFYNTLEVADKCDISFDFSETSMPPVNILPGMDIPHTMLVHAETGLRERLGQDIFQDKRYVERFKAEARVIRECGFCDYMLVVKSFTDFARNQNILVGSRGSAASSLVAFGLGIHDVDPVKYGLLFERFLNKERIEMPDVDLDLEDTRRDEVIDYAKATYGEDKVSQIATINTFGIKQSLRDVARVYEVPLDRTDAICEAIAREEDIWLNGNEQTVLTHAHALEGLCKSVGVHAAGIIVSGTPITDVVPRILGKDGALVAQIAGSDLGKTGLLKMDFLGLSNLSIVHETLDHTVGKDETCKKVESIPLDDLDVFKMLGQGLTQGVFQIESGGMTHYIKALKPTSIIELAAMVALYRPGPLGEIPRYIDGKFGRVEIDYIDPVLKGILYETFGVICFQEQVLQIAQTIAGYSLGEADVLRKAMGKKIAEIMDTQRAKFLIGAVENDFDMDLAEEIFEKIKPFAGYAFNKAHAVSYALLCYRTAYLKYHFPSEYFASLINSNREDREKVANYVAEAKRMGVKIKAPDVLSSQYATTGSEQVVCLGLSIIKGCNQALLDGIIEEEGITDIFDLVYRLKKKGICNLGTITNLVRCGATDSLGPNRRWMELYLPAANRSATLRMAEAKEERQCAFPSGATLNVADFEEVEEYSASEKFKMEVDLIGLCVNSGSILREILTFAPPYRKEVADITRAQADVTLAGVVIELRPYTTKAGRKMGYLKLEDATGIIELTVFPKMWEELGKDFFSVGQAVCVILDVKNDGERLLAIVKSATQIVPPTECLYITVDEHNARHIATVENWAREYPGIIPILFIGVNDEIVARSKYACALVPPFIEGVTDLIGELMMDIRPM